MTTKAWRGVQLRKYLRKLFVGYNYSEEWFEDVAQDIEKIMNANPS